LAVADISASESKKITVTDFLGKAVTLIADATIPNAKIVFGSASIPGSALQTGAVGATQLGTGAVTAVKLANESTVDLVTTLPVSGAFTGQFALDTDDSKAYVWDGSQWVSFKAAGSVNTVIGSTAGVVNVTITTSGDQVTIATTLDNTAAAAQFLAGPSAAAGAVGYRTITGADLPTPTTTERGGISINGEGLRLDGTLLEVDNDVTPNATASLVTYDAKGLIVSGRAIASADMPVATSAATGAVQPGTGLAVDGSGIINHSNTATPGTYTKVTVDAQGHITAGNVLAGADVPDHSAALLTSGTLNIARLGANSITGDKFANYSVSKFGETQPLADHVGQFFFNPLDRTLYLWDSNVWQPIGVSFGELIFTGTYDASTNVVASVTTEGTAIGLIVGSPLPSASSVNSRHYLVVSTSGTGTAPAPAVALAPPDLILSNGSTWTEVDVSQTVTAQTANNVAFSPSGGISATNVQAAIQELDGEKLPLAGGTMTGELIIGSTGALAFEGTTDNTYETYLAVVDPTADRTITFPDATGTVVLSGNIVNADISASAAIAYSKLATLTSGNIIVGNGSNVAASVAVTGDVTISNAGVTAIASGVIVDADINASAAVAFSKLANVSATDRLLGRSTAGAGAIEEVTCTAAGRALIDDADAAAQRTTLGLAIGTDVQAYDADTAKLDVAQTFTAVQTLTDPAIIGTILEDVFTITDGAAFEVDPGNGSIQLITLGANRTPKATNFAAGESITLMVNDGTAYTLTWTDATWGASGVAWTGGSAPTLATSGYTVLQFWKVSTQVYGALVGEVA
jgi:hypothetical protein